MRNNIFHFSVPKNKSVRPVIMQGRQADGHLYSGYCIQRGGLE